MLLAIILHQGTVLVAVGENPGSTVLVRQVSMGMFRRESESRRMARLADRTSWLLPFLTDRHTLRGIATSGHSRMVNAFGGCEDLRRTGYPTNDPLRRRILLRLLLYQTYGTATTHCILILNLVALLARVYVGGFSSLELSRYGRVGWMDT